MSVRTGSLEVGDADCLVGAGEMDVLVSTFDWAGTCLGPRSTWGSP